MLGQGVLPFSAWGSVCCEGLVHPEQPPSYHHHVLILGFGVMKQHVHERWLFLRQDVQLCLGQWAAKGHVP